MSKASERTKAWRARHPDIRAYRAAEARKWRKAHPDKLREIQRRAREKDRAKELDKRRSALYRQKVGKEVLSKRRITKSLNRRENMAGKSRSACCDICGERGVTVYDHDHRTGEFRGWLCQRCNRVLGSVKDSPELLLRLARYLHGDNERRRKKGRSQEQIGFAWEEGDWKLPVN